MLVPMRRKLHAAILIGSLMLAILSAEFWVRSQRLRDQLVVPLGFGRYVLFTSMNDRGAILLLSGWRRDIAVTRISEPYGYNNQGIDIIGAGDWRYMSNPVAVVETGQNPSISYYPPRGTYVGYHRYIGASYIWTGFAFWLACLLFGAWPIVWSGLFLRRRRLVNRRRRLGLCLHCAYDLRGSPDRCPECGQVVEAAKTRIPSTSA